MSVVAVAGCNSDALMAVDPAIPDLRIPARVDMAPAELAAPPIDLALPVDPTPPDLALPIDLADPSPCGDPRGLAAAPWPMRGQCPTHRGRSPYQGTRTPRLRWAFRTGSFVISSPAVGADGTVYIGSDDGNLYALEGATGKQLWAFTTGEQIESSPAIGA